MQLKLNHRENCVAARCISAQFPLYLIGKAKLTGSELRVVIEMAVVQNNPSITR